MKKILAENKHGTGAVRQPIRRRLNRLARPKLGKSGIPFDWSRGYDVEDKIGQIPIKDQGQSDSCGGQAKAYWLGIYFALQGQPYVEQSAKSIYSRIDYPQGGTTVPALEKDLGSTDESLVPSYQNGQPPTEPWMIDNIWQASELVNTMAKRGFVAKSVNIDMESIAEAIRDYGGVIWEIEGQNNGTWLSSTPQPPISSANLWSHFMCAKAAYSITESIKGIEALQSWGKNIGLNGIQTFTDNYINSGYIVDCFTFVRIPPLTQPLTYGESNPQVQTLQQKLGMPSTLQTGYYGFITLCAVVKFEIAHGLPITSTVGPKMLAQLA